MHGLRNVGIVLKFIACVFITVIIFTSPSSRLLVGVQLIMEGHFLRKVNVPGHCQVKPKSTNKLIVKLVKCPQRSNKGITLVKMGLYLQETHQVSAMGRYFESINSF